MSDTNTNIEIQNLEETDILTAAKIFQDAFGSVGENWTLDICEQRLRSMYKKDYCFVAKYQNKIVAMMTTKTDYDMDHLELYIDILAVDPLYSKKGIGAQLLSHAETFAKSKGYTAMWLLASPELPSYDWYMKAGFADTHWKAIIKKLQ